MSRGRGWRRGRGVETPRIDVLQSALGREMGREVRGEERGGEEGEDVQHYTRMR